MLRHPDMDRKIKTLHASSGARAGTTVSAGSGSALSERCSPWGFSTASREVLHLLQKIDEPVWIDRDGRPASRLVITYDNLERGCARL